MSGQLIDASLIAAPKQRNSDGEKADIKAGKIPQDWKDKPAKLRQKDRDGRWTVKFGKAKERKDGSLPRDIAIPHFGYKAHTGIDKRYRFIRTWDVTDASRYDGRILRKGLLDKTNTGRSVWAEI
ncbi:MAG: transposase [Cohaesibacter sp.]|nr:transposase [Cohaesibacter sp.]